VDSFEGKGIFEDNLGDNFEKKKLGQFRGQFCEKNCGKDHWRKKCSRLSISGKFRNMFVNNFEDNFLKNVVDKISGKYSSFNRINGHLKNLDLIFW
jgi:hypothetical protein